MRHHMSQRDNFVYLTFALILLLLGMALAQQFFSSAVQHLMQSTTVITLLVAVWGVEKDKHILRRAAVFPVAIIVTAWTTYLVDSVGGDYLLLSLMLIFLLAQPIKQLDKCFSPVTLTATKFLELYASTY